jgi:DNA-binding IclR family transcriptional regulator
LEAFKRHNRSLSLKEIAGSCGFSLAATHRLVATLELLGVLRTDTTGRYLLGSVLAELGDQARRMAAPQAALNELVKKVADHVNETAHVAILNSWMVRYVAKAETARGLRTVTQVGKELEAYCTGVGKVLLAYTGVRARNHYLSLGEFIRLTDNTICNRDLLKAEFDKIRRVGFAIDNEEFEEGLKCIAVPIQAQNGKVIAGLSISGPASRIDRQDQEHLIAQLKQFARLIATRVAESEWAYM